MLCSLLWGQPSPRGQPQSTNARLRAEGIPLWHWACRFRTQTGGSTGRAVYIWVRWGSVCATQGPLGTRGPRFWVVAPKGFGGCWFTLQPGLLPGRTPRHLCIESWMEITCNSPTWVFANYRIGRNVEREVGTLPRCGHGTDTLAVGGCTLFMALQCCSSPQHFPSHAQVTPQAPLGSY